MMGAQLTGIILSLLGAASWGGADFSGGYASRKHHSYQVLFLCMSSSLLLLLLCAMLWRENLPSLHDLVFSLLAGISGAVGLAALYKGLSAGSAAVVAPVSAVVGAIFPMAAGIIIDGMPGTLQLVGFALALAGIWWVSRSGDDEGGKMKWSIMIATFAGLALGGFLVLITRTEGGEVFYPLAVARIASIVLASAYIVNRKLGFPRPNRAPLAILAGLLDTTGNVFVLIAVRLTRLDTAAVLSSLYPLGTVLLSRILLKEQISLKQWIGVFTCIFAIVLITL